MGTRILLVGTWSASVEAAISNEPWTPATLARRSARAVAFIALVVDPSNQSRTSKKRNANGRFYS